MYLPIDTPDTGNLGDTWQGQKPATQLIVHIPGQSLLIHGGRLHGEG